MPLYMDRHKLPSVTAEDVAHAHAQDLAVADKHGVKFHTYWFDARACSAFCLIEAPDAETLVRAHDDSHGLLPAEIIEVDAAVVEAFLGRIVDPKATTLRNEPISEPARRVVMFTDIVGSTDMTARLGDARAMDIVRSHDSVVRRELDANGGREVKHLGDGIMAAFAEEPAAVHCACAILRGADAFNTASREPLRLRIGLHAGEPVDDNHDLFGATVQIAARICADAAVDAIVVTDEVRASVADRFQLTPLGARMLKGIRQPLPLFSVDWR
jgi:class 3 adenylate cyclase